MLQGGVKIKEMLFANEILIPEIIKMIDSGHTVTLRLKGVSMRPFLEDGRDKALLSKPIPPKVGDPVLAEVIKGHYVLHRIIDINGDNITLRGDGNLSNEYCKMTDIKASVTGFYRKGRDTLDRTDGLKWRIYSKLWMALYPVRRYLLFIYRHLFIKKYKLKNEDKERI